MGAAEHPEPEVPYGGNWPDQAGGEARLLPDDGDPGQPILAPNIDGFHPAYEPLAAAAAGGLSELGARVQSRTPTLDLASFLYQSLAPSVVYSSRPDGTFPGTVHYDSHPSWKEGSST